MPNKYARMQEKRLQEENPFEYKLMKKNGTLDEYLRQYGNNATAQEANLYTYLDEKMTFPDEDKLTEEQRKSVYFKWRVSL